MSKAHIANHFIRASIQGAMQQGFSADEILTQSQIPTDWLDNPQQLVTEEQFTRLIKTLWKLTKDEFIGLGNEKCPKGTFGLMAEFCLSAETLGTMLSRSARFYRVVHPNLDMKLDEEETKDNSLIFFRIDIKDEAPHFLQEFILLMWQRFSCWLVDQKIPFTETHFSYAKPSHASEYSVIYPGRHVYSQKQSGFYLHTKYLQMPLVRNEMELRDFLKKSPAYILHRPPQDETLSAKIRALLKQHDYMSIPSLEELTETLSLTSRTISRQLRTEGTSYSKIKESIRREYAIKLLTTEYHSLSDITERLGFSETASFCRAFKKWTGKGPSVWRREHSQN